MITYYIQLILIDEDHFEMGLKMCNNTTVKNIFPIRNMIKLSVMIDEIKEIVEQIHDYKNKIVNLYCFFCRTSDSPKKPNDVEENLHQPIKLVTQWALIAAKSAKERKYLINYN
jgi:hypothetical protein